jgi:hypothetical protein
MCGICHTLVDKTTGSLAAAAKGPQRDAEATARDLCVALLAGELVTHAVAEVSKALARGRGSA